MYPTTETELLPPCCYTCLSPSSLSPHLRPELSASLPAGLVAFTTGRRQQGADGASSSQPMCQAGGHTGSWQPVSAGGARCLCRGREGGFLCSCEGLLYHPPPLYPWARSTNYRPQDVACTCWFLEGNRPPVSGVLASAVVQGGVGPSQ